MTEIIRNLDEKLYHSQAGRPEPLFTYSAAKTIIQKSPYHAYLKHPKLGGESHSGTKAMNRGSIIHGLLLGGGQEIAVIEADSFRTNASKAERDEAEAAGKIPILKKDMDEIDAAIVSIKKQIEEIAPYFFDKHEAELTLLYELGNGVKCQSRIDWLSLDLGKIIDVKTTADSSPDKVEKQILNMGYDIQQALYTLACEKCFPELAGRFTWEFLFIETEPPYMVSIVETEASVPWLGMMKVDRASFRWAECMESGKWPGYGRFSVSAPSWAINKEEAILNE